MTANRTLYIVLLSFVLLLFSKCQNNDAGKTVTDSLIEDSISNPETSLTSKSDHNENSLEIQKREESAKLIEGTYVVINEQEESDQCEMTIIIERTSGGYTYKFNTESRSLSGKLSAEATEEKDGYYISLEGISWSEYEGELDDDGAPKVKDLVLPMGINGIIKDNQISIQNTGNSMNYYVKLADCGKKYIRLQKK